MLPISSSSGPCLRATSHYLWKGTTFLREAPTCTRAEHSCSHVLEPSQGIQCCRGEHLPAGDVPRVPLLYQVTLRALKSLISKGPQHTYKAGALSSCTEGVRLELRAQENPCPARISMGHFHGIRNRGEPPTLVELKHGSPAVLLAWAKSQVLVCWARAQLGSQPALERTEPALTPEGIKKKPSTGTHRMQSLPRPHHLK